MAASIVGRMAVIVAVGFAGGIALQPFVSGFPFLMVVGLLAGVAAVGLARRDAAAAAAGRWVGGDWSRVLEGLALLAILLMAAQAGVWREGAASAAAEGAASRVEGFLGTQQIRGLVADDPAPKARTTSLTMTDVLVKTPAGWQPLGGEVLVSVPHQPEHEYGEELQLRGKLQPLPASGAAQALERQGVLASMAYPQVAYLANPSASPFRQALFRLRYRLAATIDATLPEPAASALAATLLGLKSTLPAGEQQALIATGTVHLIVISGFKLSLIAAGLQALGALVLRRTTARGWARGLVVAGVLIAIAAYTVLTGATPSAIRAAVMAGVVAVAVLAGRPHDQMAALAIAVVSILAANPFELVDGGLQLSCLSVAGIALLAEPIALRLRAAGRAAAAALARLPASASMAATLAGWLAAGLAEAAGASTAATLFDLPVLASSFHVVSLISPVANLLGMPVLAPLMMFGGLGAAVGSVFAPLGGLFLWPAWAFTTLLLWIVHTSAAIPHAALSVDSWPAAAVAGWYVALLGVVWLFDAGPALAGEGAMAVGEQPDHQAALAGQGAMAVGKQSDDRPTLTGQGAMALREQLDLRPALGGQAAMAVREQLNLGPATRLGRRLPHGVQAVLWPAPERHRRRPPRGLTWGLTAVAAAGVVVAALVGARRPPDLRVTFLAVPGEATLIQTAQGRNILINAGENGPVLAQELGALLSPWDRTLDLVIVTSPRTDRSGGLPDIFARYQVQGLIEPDLAQPPQALRTLPSTVPRLTIAVGDTLDLGGGAALRLLAPDDLHVAKPADADKQTMVWRLEHASGSLLLAGRLPIAQWSALGPVQDAVVESTLPPPAQPGGLWIVPVASAAASSPAGPPVAASPLDQAVDESREAIRLAQSGNVTLIFGRQLVIGE